MKVLLITALLSSFSVMAQTTDYGYLKSADQQFYKNDQMEGNNKQERIDSLVKEMNKVYAELAAQKKEMAQLKADMEALKAAQASQPPK